MKKMTLGLIAALILFFSPSADAQELLLSGRVTDQNSGNPIEGATVQAYVYGTFDLAGEAQTDADGHYAIPVNFSPDDMYGLVATAPTYIMEFFNNTTVFYQATLVSPFDELASSINFTLEHGGAVSGRITNKSGGPAAGVTVHLLSSGNVVGTGVTVSDGTYTTSGVGAGSYVVQAVAHGTPYIGGYYYNAAGIDTATPVAVLSGAVTPNINFSLGDAGSISGVIKDSNGAPVVGATVVTVGASYDTQATTGPDGSYTLLGMDTGSYTIYASHSLYIGKYFYSAYEYELAIPVPLTVGDQIPGIDITLDSMGSISGIVKDEGGRPIVGAQVQAFILPDVTLVSDVQTSATGSYTLQGLQSGNYAVRIAHPLYIEEYFDNSVGWITATPVAVDFGVDTPNINAVLQKLGSLSGTVIEDETGQPIADATVTVTSTGEGQPLIVSVQTNTNGAYVASGLRTGNYMVFVTHLLHASEYYDNTYDQLSAAQVAVVVGAETAGINVSLARLSTITGTVRTAGSGLPIAGAAVVASGGSPEGMYGTQSLSDGTYTIIGVQPGSYVVSAETLTYPKRYHPAADTLAGAAAVVVATGGSAEGVDVALAAGGSISGTVTGQELFSGTGGGVAVYVLDPVTGSFIGATQTSDAGTYLITGLRAGAYKVYAEAYADVFMAQYYSNAVDLASAATVTVIAGSATQNINFSLAPTTQLAGSVREEGSWAPIAGISVTVSNGTTTRIVRTSADGYFTIIGLPDGDYTIFADAGGTSYISEYFDNAFDRASAQPVQVYAWGGPQSIGIFLGKKGSISGVVQTENGDPLAGIWVRAGNGTQNVSVQTNGSGAYTIANVMPNTYKVQADATGTFYLSEYYNDTRSAASANNVFVESGLDTPNINFMLALSGSISGVVTSATTSAGVLNAAVKVYDASGFTPVLLATAETTTNGAYEVKGIPAGNWLVMAEAAADAMLVRQVYSNVLSRETYSAVAVVGGNVTAGIDFSLVSGGTITGAVLDDGGDSLAGVLVRAVLQDGTETASTLTDENGIFVLGGVPVGRSFVAVLPGTSTFSGKYFVGQFYGGVTFRGESTSVDVLDKTVTPNVNFALQQGTLMTGMIAADWQPPSDARINLFDVTKNRWLIDSAIETNYAGPLAGTWSAVVPASYYMVQAEARTVNGNFPASYFAGYGYMTVYNFDQADYVQVQPGQQVRDGVDLYLELPTPYFLKGAVSYSGVQTGRVIIWVDPFSGNGWPHTSVFKKRHLGAYALTVRSYGGGYVKAFMDVNGNGIYDPGEPFGEHTDSFGFPLQVDGPTSEDVTGIDIQLAEPSFTVRPGAGAYMTSISPDTPQLVTYGSTTSFTIAVVAGHYPTVADNGCNGILSGLTYTTGPITFDCNVTIDAFGTQPVLSVTKTGYGTVTSTSGIDCGSTCSMQSDPGAPVTLTATPGPGSVFSGWSGDCSGSAVDCQLTMDWSKGVHALFTAVTFTITPAANQHGSIIPGTQQTAYLGDQKTFAVVPMPGYTLVGASGCNGALVGNLFTTGSIAQDCAISATFALRQYAVTPDPGPNGSFNPATSIMVDPGGTATFTITPDAGYHLTSVSGCGVAPVGNNSYTTGQVHKNCTVSALFDNVPPAIPVLVAPASNSQVANRTPQLSVSATDGDNDPLTYRFEVSPVADFSIVVAHGTVGPLPSGNTATWTVSRQLNDNTRYYWRALAKDGAASSVYMSSATFFLNMANDAPLRPAINAPAIGVQIDTLTPMLSVIPGGDIDGDVLTYEFTVSLNSSFTNTVDSVTGAGETWTTQALQEDTVYYWHSRARDPFGAVSPWTSTAWFYVNASNASPTVPVISAPASGSEVGATTQTLTVLNSTDPEGTVPAYLFEIASNNTFTGESLQASPVIHTGVGAGSTSWTPAALQDNTRYYWRVKASDGAAESAWTTAATFFVNIANEAPATPTINYPADAAAVTTIRPELSVNAAFDVDQDVLTYEFEVYSEYGLHSLVKSAVDQGTSWTMNGWLSDNTWYYWRARARDVHGLAGPWTALASFFVNNNGYNDPPSITLVTPGVSSYLTKGQTYAITWIDSDPDSNAMITLGYDTTGEGYNGTVIDSNISENDPGNTYTWDISGLGDGTYHVYAIISDGTTTLSTYAPPLVINRTLPIAVVMGAPVGSTPATTAVLTVGGAENTEYRYRLDGGSLSTTRPVATPISLSGLADGSHTVEVFAKDRWDLWQFVATTVTWTVDTVAPDTVLTDHPANPSATSSPSFSFTSEPGAAFECKLDSASFAPCTSPQAYASLAEASHTFDVRAIDIAGNVDQTPAHFAWSVQKDTTPDSFTFDAQNDVPLGTTLTSNAITVSGINAAATISITGGTYSVTGGAFTSVAGTITNGKTVIVRVASSPNYSTAKSATLTIGGATAVFTVTTGSADTTPDPFSFASQTGIALGVLVTSNTATVTGINSAAAINVIGGSYSVNGGAFTTAASTVNSGDGIRVQVLSSIDYGTASVVSLTLGGVTASFTATTLTVVNDSLASATDTLTADPARSWTTGGDASWFGESAVFASGGSAAQSGRVGAGGSSWIQTQVTGTFTLAFFQKVSSQSNKDLLHFSIDGVEKGKISGNVSWQQKLYSVTTGNAGAVHTLRWTYTKDPTISSGLDAGWIDSVRISPYGKTAVVYPNGGETLHTGIPVLIQWHAQAQAEKFILYYTTDGTNWHPITPDYVTGASFTWTDVPAVSSVKCKVKVVSYSAANKSLSNDISNAAFTIAP